MNTFEIIDNETGELLSIEQLGKILSIEKQNYFMQLHRKFKENAFLMTDAEFHYYRNLRKQPKEIKLNFDGRFALTNFLTLEFEKSLSIDTVYFLRLVKYITNKEGVIVDNSGRPMKSYSSVRDSLEISERKWKRVAKDIKRHDILRKVIFERKTFIVVNPVFEVRSLNIGIIRFFSFWEYIRKLVGEFNFITLCFEHRLNPTDGTLRLPDVKKEIIQ